MQSPDFRIDSLLLSQCFPDSRYADVGGYNYNSPYNFSIQDIITSTGPSSGPISSITTGAQFNTLQPQVSSANGSPVPYSGYPGQSHIPPPQHATHDEATSQHTTHEQYPTSCSSLSFPHSISNGVTDTINPRNSHPLIPPPAALPKSEYFSPNSCLGILDDDPTKRRMDFMVKHAWLPPRPLAPKGPGCKLSLGFTL